MHVIYADARKSLMSCYDALSLCFNGTKMSPFWILLALRVMEVVVTAGTIKTCKAPVKCHHQQTNTTFYRPHVRPVTQPTVSEHWREMSRYDWK